MSDYVIIVAGGKGLRMGSDIPKQFLPIGGKPVLMRTIERFREYSKDLQIILVLPESQQEYWQELCKEYSFPLPPLGEDGGGFTYWPTAERHASTLCRTAWHWFLTMPRAWLACMTACDHSPASR